MHHLAIVCCNEQSDRVLCRIELEIWLARDWDGLGRWYSLYRFGQWMLLRVPLFKEIPSRKSDLVDRVCGTRDGEETAE